MKELPSECAAKETCQSFKDHFWINERDKIILPNWDIIERSKVQDCFNKNQSFCMFGAQLQAIIVEIQTNDILNNALL